MGNWHSHTEKLQRLASAEVALLEHSASPDKCHWQTACTDIRVASNDYTIHSIQVTPLPGSNANSSDDDTPLILLHGFMNVSGLSKYFSNIYALDWLGWGRSSRPRGVLSHTGNTIDTAEAFFVDSLEAWRQQHGFSKMILAGHSLGGYLSVAYAERYPQHVEQLVLCSPVGVPVESEETIKRRAQQKAASWKFRLGYGWYEFLFARWTPGDILRALPPSYGRRRIQDYIQRRLPAIVDPHEQTVLADYLYYNATLPGSGEYCLQTLLTPALFGKRPLVHRIPKLNIAECHFLYGEHDWMDPEGGLQVQQLCQQVSGPSITVHQVQNAGHLLMLDNHEAFNNGVAQVASKRPVWEGPVPKQLQPTDSTSGVMPEESNE